MDQDWVGLADAVAALRRELTTAIVAGRDAEVRFGMGPVEMEFLLEVTREGGGEAGIRFGVITLAGKGSISSASTHRVKLILQPQDRAGRAAEIADTEEPGTDGLADAE